MTVEDFTASIKPRRKVEGIAAALLPFEADGRVAVEAFSRHLLRTQQAGLMNAVNMDTGYANYLADSEKRQVLQWTRDALGARAPFVAGAYIEGREGEIVALYRRSIDEIVSFGGTPILFQTSRAHGVPWQEKVRLYQQICKRYERVIAFELGAMFAPNGEIFDDNTVRGLMDVPELVGIKHSSLDRTVELSRLKLRDARRPAFRIYTGNDLGINMIEYGSDYLLGLATFAPEKFAQRDRLWEQGDAAYYELSDALQLLGNIAFRPPVPAYKHSAAIFLHLTGRIPTSRTHAHSPTRPDWEVHILRDVARTLGAHP